MSEEHGLVVLDTSAVLAYLLRERGWQTVQPLLAGGLLSSVNLCEVVSTFCERGEDAVQVQADVLALGLGCVPFSDQHALAAAQLRPLTRSLGLSLGDRACLALGLERGGSVVTADVAWSNLSAPHRVQVLR